MHVENISSWLYNHVVAVFVDVFNFISFSIVMDAESYNNFHSYDVQLFYFVICS